MKFILVTWLLIASCLNHACDETINMVYGPFLSAGVYNEYVYEFHENIERITGCHINSQIISSYEAYLKRLIRGDIYMTFVPRHYEYALSQYGFKRMLKGGLSSRVLLLAKKKNYRNMNISQLDGATVLVPSIYTHAYLYLRDWLQESAMTEKVKISTDFSHDEVVMNLVSDRASVGVLSSIIFNRMPRSVRDEFIVFKESAVSPAVLMISEDLPEIVRGAIIDSISLINLGDWYESSESIVPGEHAKIFKRQLEALLAN